ncbi:MAG: hypothetical protein BWK79_19410 [Beggiatoa sp. IS2]|nr:MAG: hypothetical protein BWK79_19410 [Beggiatoa sp. IS2]
MNIKFLIIDPQNDFADPSGSLFVSGADKDSERLATLLNRLLTKINSIHVTLDTHHFVDIAHPIFWIDSQGSHPSPFTQITEEDIVTGKWRTTRTDYQNRAVDYVKALSTNSRYILTIWPPHCLIGQTGHNVVTPIMEALSTWENTFATVDYVLKGSNQWTEHYSAIKADVPDASDPTTQLNTRLLTQLQEADIIAISGQTLSHCVANTVRDIVNNVPKETVDKMVLIADTSSPVPGFEVLAEQFLSDMKGCGMQIVKSTAFLV